ncbi:MAG: hypothetical protein ABGX27_03920 [Desulfurobacteriaceae bacterium]
MSNITWDTVIEAIDRLKRSKRAKRRNLLKLLENSLIEIDGVILIVKEAEPHDDWAEYMTEDITGRKFYIEVEIDESFTVWKKLTGGEKVRALQRLKFDHGAVLLEEGKTEEETTWT